MTIGVPAMNVLGLGEDKLLTAQIAVHLVIGNSALKGSDRVGRRAFIVIRDDLDLAAVHSTLGVDFISGQIEPPAGLILPGVIFGTAKDQIREAGSKIDIVGWSDGGIVALDIAIRHEERAGKIFAFAANMVPSGVKDNVEKNPTFAGFIADPDEPAPIPFRLIFRETQPQTITCGKSVAARRTSLDRELSFAGCSGA
jgi:hypothetical protein